MWKQHCSVCPVLDRDELDRAVRASFFDASNMWDGEVTYSTERLGLPWPVRDLDVFIPPGRFETASIPFHGAGRRA
jgi:hypothetical protein